MSTGNGHVITLQGFLKPYLSNSKIYLSVLFITCIIGAAEQSLHAYLLKIVIDTVSLIEPAKLLQAVLWPAIFYVGMDLYHNLTMRAYLFTCMKYFPALKKKVMNDLFEHTAEHSISFFQTNLAGDIAGKIQDVTNIIEPLIRQVFEVFISRAMMPIIAMVFLSLISWHYSAIFLVWTIAFVLCTVHLSKPVGVYSHQLAANKNQLSGKLVDVLGNIVTAKMFGRTSFEKDNLNQTMNTVKQSEVKVHWSLLRLHFIQGLFTLSLISCFMFLLIKGRMNNDVSVGDFVFVLTLLVTSLSHIYALGQGIGDTIKYINEFRQAINILLLPHDVVDKEGAEDIKVMSGEIKLCNVDFAYVPEKPIFDKLNVTIKPGEKVGIVGPSGAGKSTLINLLLRLFELQSGSVLIDNQNINDVTLKSLRRNITLVPQQTDLFHRSILDNIRYGHLEATDAEIVEAAKLAECDEFIMSLPEQYNTLVGERGVKLSGGQKQRLAIARAYLKPAKILILDEATSALDSITETYIQRSLKQIMENKTTLVIAHRLATLRQMDRILVFEKGRIVQDGTLEELRNKPGTFANLWEHQNFLET